MKNLRSVLFIPLYFLSSLVPATATAQDCMIGEVRWFAGNFSPRNWALAHGQLLAISQNQALFSILGTNFGGDGRSTFGLPDLRGRSLTGTGASSNGGNTYHLGQAGGTEMVQLTESQIPAHNHGLQASTARAKSTDAKNRKLASTRIYSDKAPDVAMSSNSISAAGGSQPHSNLPPFLVMNPIICVHGIYPSRQ